jgi:prevent-host-death family protein
MANHSMTETKNKLSELIDRAIGGEAVVITRRGRPVAELRPVVTQRPAGEAPGPVTLEDIEWLAARRVGRRAGPDAGTLVSQMRDDEAK